MDFKFIPEEDYKKIMEYIPIVCVDVFVHYKDKILLVKRRDEPGKGLWWFIGGRIYKNETLEKAAIRKVKEEAGIDTVIEKKVGVYETIFKKTPFKEIKTGIHTVNIVFIVNPKSEPKLNLDKTITGYKWISKIPEDLHWYPKQALLDSGILK